MDSTHLIILESGHIWDIYNVKQGTCSTSGDIFINFKKSLKNASFGYALVFDDVCCLCNCQRKSLNINSKNEGIDRSIQNEVSCETNRCCDCIHTNRRIRKPRVSIQLNGYELSVFIYCLLTSAIYRKAVINNMKSLVKSRKISVLPVKILLIPPTRHTLDYAWARRLEQLAHEWMILNITMSWLSTLGGAFSALGEAKTYCAGIAARISVHQFKIAIRLGDLHTVSRCKLYLALSLMQRNRLKIARKIIYDQYQMAKDTPEQARDIRLIRMCQGLWAKLKYAFDMQRLEKHRHSKGRLIEQ